MRKIDFYLLFRPVRKKSPALTRDFFARSTELVARDLLGVRLVAGKSSGIIVETEAYFGEHDLASHARFGPTKRNQLMYGPPGFAYVYLIYGMYNMFNIVTEQTGRPAAVLIRALSPEPEQHPHAMRGPGKLCRALAITREHNGIDLLRSQDLTLVTDQRFTDDQIACGPRIGVAYAGEWAQKPLRFWLKSHPAVTRAK